MHLYIKMTFMYNPKFVLKKLTSMLLVLYFTIPAKYNHIFFLYNI